MGSGVCVYHKDTYAPLPADRKDKVLEVQCENGSRKMSMATVECEEFVSFKKKMKSTEEEMAQKNSSLSIDKMKEGRFTLIEKLMNILMNEYKLDGEKIKRETDDVIDR